MVQIPISTAWTKGKAFKKPFFYAMGKGILDEAEAETWNVEDGQLVFMHRLDMGDLLKLGIANEMDFMSKALMSADPKPGQSDANTVADVVKKAENYENMERMINLVVSGGLIEPKVYAIPEHAAARQEGLLYADEVPWDDRMEMFSAIFETEGLSTFRQEQESGVGDLADVTDVSLPADGSVDIRSDDTEGVLLQSGSIPLREDGGNEDGRSGESVEEEQEARTGS